MPRLAIAQRFTDVTFAKFMEKWGGKCTYIQIIVHLPSQTIGMDMVALAGALGNDVESAINY